MIITHHHLITGLLTKMLMFQNNIIFALYNNKNVAN